jgi:predicted Zn-dependent protease with MMP-like domain
MSGRIMSVFVSEKEFRSIAADVLDGLPERFRRVVENVTVVVEDWPAEEDLVAIGLDPEEDTIFGLYQGVSLGERGLDYSGLPDRIVLYRMPILEACVDRQEVAEEIRLTVLHEIGHYFGLEEEELP